MEGAVAALLGGTAGRIALDDEQFGLGGIAILAIGELARERGEIERALAAREVLGLARGFAGEGGFHHLADDLAGFAGMFFEPAAELLRHDAFHHRAHLGGDQLVLGLGGELRIGDFHGQHAGEAFAHVFASDGDLVFLVGFGRVVIQRARQCATEAGQVGTAVFLRDVVGETQRVLVIARVPLQRQFDGDAVAFAGDGDRMVVDPLIGAIEIFHERFDPALVVQVDRLGLRMARIDQLQVHA